MFPRVKTGQDNYSTDDTNDRFFAYVGLDFMTFSTIEGVLLGVLH